MQFLAISALVALLAGAVASVCGFGIGSMLTPMLAIQEGTKLAIAAVSIPHFVATAARCWMLRKDIDKKVLLSFGITSAVGGLVGALAHNYIENPSLTVVFGIILLLAGILGLSGWSERLRLGGLLAWVAGLVSGGLGGLVGNQGGIRAAAMLGFELQPQAFVATATAIGIVVDCARMPIYFYCQLQEIEARWPLVLIATIAVLIGTFIGTGFLRNIDRTAFKRAVSAVIVVLGAFMLYSGLFGRR